MVYLLKLVIFHGYVSHNQMVAPAGDISEPAGPSASPGPWNI